MGRASGGQPGNTNAAKRKLWHNAVRSLALANHSEKLTAVIHKLFALALEGDMDAITEIRETLDGKVKQVIQHEGDKDAPLVIQVTASAALQQKIRGVLEKTSERVINGDDTDEAHP